MKNISRVSVSCADKKCCTLIPRHHQTGKVGDSGHVLKHWATPLTDHKFQWFIFKKLSDHHLNIFCFTFFLKKQNIPIKIHENAFSWNWLKSLRYDMCKCGKTASECCYSSNYTFKCIHAICVTYTRNVWNFGDKIFLNCKIFKSATFRLHTPRNNVIILTFIVLVFQTFIKTAQVDSAECKKR